MGYRVRFMIRGQGDHYIAQEKHIYLLTNNPEFARRFHNTLNANTACSKWEDLFRNFHIEADGFVENV